MRKALILVLILISALAFSVEYATTDDGERVLLYSNGTWEYVETKEEWQTVFSISSSSSKETKQFEISSDEWRITVSSSDELLYLWMRDQEGNLVKKLLTMKEPGHETLYLYNPGIYSLDIISSGSYKITVEQKNYQKIIKYTGVPNIEKIIFEGDLIETLCFEANTPKESVEKLFKDYQVISGNYYIELDYNDYDGANGTMIFDFENNVLNSININIFMPQFVATTEFKRIKDFFIKTYGEIVHTTEHRTIHVWEPIENIMITLGYYKEKDETFATVDISLIKMSKY